MTTVRFYFANEVLYGFEIKGHSTFDEDDEQGRLVCASISSAAYMTANTVTEIIGANADISVDEEKGEMILKVLSEIESCATVLMGFMFHIEQLSKQYDDYITVTTEV